MNDHIETPVENIPADLAIRLNSPVGIVGTALALYGAKALVNDARRTVNTIREARKSSKARKAEQSAPEA